MQGLPNSLPVVSSLSFTINEDGQSESSLEIHYGNPAYNDHIPCEGSHAYPLFCHTDRSADSISYNFRPR